MLEVLYNCLPAGTHNVTVQAPAGGQPVKQPVKMAASELREQSVADMGRLQELDSLMNLMFSEDE